MNSLKLDVVIHSNILENNDSVEKSCTLHSFHGVNLVSSVTVSEPKLSSKNPDNILHHLKLKLVNRLDIGHLNINSSRNKFDTLIL